MSKVVTFGEMLLRLSTENHLRFSQARSFRSTYAGGEFNVSVSLANYGVETEFITRLPDNDFGNCALREMRICNVKSNNVIFGGERLGIYFLETGAGVRGSKVVYDRTNSSLSTIKTGMIDWKRVLKGTSWFHWSGVTPAVSQSAAEVCLEAVKVAHELGITISADLNYRSKLWKYGKAPSQVMPELLKYSNVILGDLDTAFFLLDKERQKVDYQDTRSLPKLYDLLFKVCPNLRIMATTLRFSVNASHQKIGGVLYNGKELILSGTKEVTPVVDRVGSGDAFMGGLIYGLLQKEVNLEMALNFAVAACCLKHTIEGDYNLVSLEDVEQLISGDSSGKVSR